MTTREGIEIDYCAQCRGIWLDRGELDKIIERTPGNSEARQPNRQKPEEKHYEPRDYRKEYDPRYHKKHKREGFLSDLFDF